MPENIAKPAKNETIEFWKRLNEAKIIFLWSQDMEFNSTYEVKEEMSLEYNLRPTAEQNLKNNKYVIQKKSTHDTLKDLLNQSNELEDNCRAILCLPNDVFFLGYKKFGSQLLI